MVSKIDLSPLPPFDPLTDPSSLSQRWKAWKKHFQTYLTAMNITNDKQKKALLLYQASEATQEIFEMLPDTGEDYETAQAKLDGYFSPKKNIDYKIFQFRQAVQEPGETIDQFVTRLRKLAATCDFHDVSKEIKSAVIQSCQSKRLRRYALREDSLSLDNLLAKARSLEACEVQASGMEKKLPSEQVNKISQTQHTKAPIDNPENQYHSNSNICRQCGLTWPHDANPCPAIGQVCRKMDRIFSTHGTPLTVKSDNGPPFTSDEIKKYMEENGIKHCRITPQWPQANSEAENFMKPLTKAVRSAHM